MATSEGFGGEYHHSPLPGPEHIRILTLLDPQGDGYIRGTLDAVPLDEAEDEYTALSYSWGMDETGDVSLNHELWISGNRMAITQNLFEGLRRILERGTFSQLPLWIDAVCINQADVEERTRQVSMMAKIYSLALGTLAWLGEGNRNQLEDKTAHDTMHCLISHKSFHFDHEPVVLANGLTTCDVKGAWSSDSEDPSSKVPLPNELLEPALGLGRIILRIVERRYFFRRWVVQETFHAKSAAMLWGSEQIPLGDFVSSLCYLIALMRSAKRSAELSSEAWPSPAHDLWREISDLSALLFKRCHGIIELFDLKELLQEKHRVPILQTLSYCSYRECSDPHDVLYSVFSLSPEHGLDVDYSLSVKEAYIAFSRYLLDKGCLGPLIDASNSVLLLDDRSSIPPDVPSWMPDWKRIDSDCVKRYEAEEGTLIEDDGTLVCEIFVIKRIDTPPAEGFEKGDIYCSISRELCGMSATVLRPLTEDGSTCRKILFSDMLDFLALYEMLDECSSDDLHISAERQWVRII